MFSDLDNYLFKKGVHYELYEKLGAYALEKADEIRASLKENNWQSHFCIVFDSL